MMCKINCSGGCIDCSPEDHVIVGATYMVSLQQDWATCLVEHVNARYVVINWHGRLHRYGVSQYREIVDLSHFVAAYSHAPAGDWSRMYHDDRDNDDAGYPAG